VNACAPRADEVRGGDRLGVDDPVDHPSGWEVDSGCRLWSNGALALRLVLGEARRAGALPLPGFKFNLIANQFFVV